MKNSYLRIAISLACSLTFFWGDDLRAQTIVPTAGIVYVKVNGVGNGSSWNNATNKLQGAIDVAGVSQVWVAAGTYQLMAGISYTMKNGVAIYGGFPMASTNETGMVDRNWVTNPTILRGNADVSVIKNQFSDTTPLTATAVLDGFTLTNGGGTFDRNSRYGGGMFNYYASPTLVNLNITGNKALGSDGETAVIRYGGGICNYYSSPTLTNIIISDNVCYLSGGGMFNEESSLSLTDVTIRGNIASTGGGMVNRNGIPIMTNVVISGNTGDAAGGGMFNSTCSPILTNVTISGNNSFGRGGGIYNQNSSSPQIRNSIIYGNSSGISNDDPAVPQISNSLVEGLTSTANGNIDATGISTSQVFIDAPNSNFTLVAGSPAINKGANALFDADKVPNLSAILTDVAGNQRIIGGTIDMGAYESSYVVAVISPIANQIKMIGDPDFPISPSSTNPSIPVTLTSGNPTVATILPGNIIHIVSSGIVSITANQAASGNYLAANPVSFNLSVNQQEYVGNLTSIIKFSNPDQATIYKWTNNNTVIGLAATGVGDIAPFTPIAEGIATITVQAYESNGSTTIGTPQTVTLTIKPATPILYVKQTFTGTGESWDNSLGEVADALVIARSNSSVKQIWVAAGTYKPTSGTDRFQSFVMKNNVAIYGGFAGGENNLNLRNFTTNVTTLSGEIGQPGDSDNSYHVVNNENNGLNNTAVLDGFTISGGNAHGNGNNRFGGGMFNNLSSPKITNCIFTGNKAFYDGGGMHNTFSSPDISHCLFSFNTGTNGAGIQNENSSSPTLLNCIFSNNSAERAGGGMESRSSSVPTLTNCSFTNNSANYGGGMENYITSPILINCSFRNNTAISGAGMYNNSSASPSVTNCVFYGNVASNSGGGMHNFASSSPIVTNCTFSRNSAVTDGGGMFSEVSAQVVKNTIFWDNGSEIGNASGTLLDITYSIIENGYYGQGNLDIDPVFEDAAIGNLQIRPCSPAMDAGDNGANITPTDLAGNQRINRTIDMGAYESTESPAGFSIATAALKISKKQSPKSTTRYANGCNDLIASITGVDFPNTIFGNTEAKVWIDAEQNGQYVKRHFEITPDNNAEESYGFVTLYFTQEEFDSFNDVNGLKKLPVDGDDADNKKNLLIEKRGGQATDENGSFSTYPGLVSTIDPEDNDIVWNREMARWEVTFVAEGFSGFWVKTQANPLPVRLMSFTGNRQENKNILNWETTEEVNASHFEIESSADAVHFMKIGEVTAKSAIGENVYTYTDNNGSASYYRLKMVDRAADGIDGTYTYSKIIHIDGDETESTTWVYPSPTTDKIVLDLGANSTLINTSASLVNSSGQVFQTKRLSTTESEWKMINYPAGIYIIRFADGSFAKFVKQ